MTGTRGLVALAILLIGASVLQAAARKDNCYKSWIFKDRSGREVFRIWVCEYSYGKSGYYKIQNLLNVPRRACWSIRLGKGKDSDGCRTLGPRETGTGSCYSCNRKNGGAVSARLKKFYDPGKKSKPFDGSVVGPGGQTGDIGLNPVGKPPPKSRPRPTPKPEGPNIVDIPEGGGKKYGVRPRPIRGINPPRRRPIRPIVSPPGFGGGTGFPSVSPPGFGGGFPAPRPPTYPPGFPAARPPAFPPTYPPAAPRTATRGAPVPGTNPTAACGMGPNTMAEFAVMTTDRAAIRARLQKLTSILECLDRQPGTPESMQIKSTLNILRQSMQMMQGR